MQKKSKRIKYFITIVIVALFSFSTLQNSVFGLNYTKTISGYVTDIHGVAIENARVDLQQNILTFPPTWNNVKTVYTNAQGYYTLTYTGSARFYNLKVSKANYLTQNYPIMWRDNNPITVNSQLATIFPIVTTFQGYIYDDIDFTPVSGVLVRLYKQSGSSWNLEKFMTTGSNGHYDLTSFPTSSYPTYKIEISGKCVQDCRLFYPTQTRTYTENFYADVYRKYVIVVGIGDYAFHTDAFGCDDDMEDWRNFFINTKGFPTQDIWCYGDGGESWEEGLATEINVRAKVQEVSSKADANDIIVFTFAGHGSRNLLTAWMEMYYYKAWVENYEKYKSTELKDDLKDSAAGKIFICIAACYSGEFTDTFDSGDYTAQDNIFLVTAAKGWQKSKLVMTIGTTWVKAFLDEHWLQTPNDNLEDIFTDAHDWIYATAWDTAGRSDSWDWEASGGEWHTCEPLYWDGNENEDMII